MCIRDRVTGPVTWSRANPEYVCKPVSATVSRDEDPESLPATAAQDPPPTNPRTVTAAATMTVLRRRELRRCSLRTVSSLAVRALSRRACRLVFSVLLLILSLQSLRSRAMPRLPGLSELSPANIVREAGDDLARIS